MTDKDEVNGTVIESMAEIEAAEDIEFAVVEGFKPGQPFKIGSLTAGDLIEWSEANEGEAKRTAGLRLIQKSLVNSKGERYAANDPRAIDVFRKKNHKTTERIVTDILKLNGMNVKADTAAKKD
jgi:hypothetical protein